MKIYRIISMVLAALLYTSCAIEEENLFKESSATRINKAILETRDILAKAPNGWHASYFPSPTQAYGGFNLLLSFTNDGKMTAMSEIDPTKKVTSEYTTYQSAGVILSMNGYNDVIQYFTSPVNPDGIGKKGYGMEGEMEFRVMELTPNRIVLSGKKYGAKVVLTPLKEGEDWTQHLEMVRKAIKDMAFSVYEYKAGNTTAKVVISNRNLQMTYQEEGNQVTKSFPYMPTANGFRLYKSINIGNIETFELIYSFKEDHLFTSTNGATLQGLIIPLNEGIQAGTWDLQTSGMSEKMRVLLDQANAILTEQEGEVLSGYRFSNGIQFLVSSGRYLCTFWITMQKVSDTGIQITFDPQIKDGNARYYLRYKQFADFIKALGGKFELSTEDSPRFPRNIKLISVTDPDIYFTVKAR
ncbi:DUF4302 domain-containing protein [Bacteroides pyogenes]|uniref:DUF4302 domain-containing protein n=1 Tax=Bacteroides pyogenes TaxID=310300 RepID=UPI001BAD96B3|nr:DUF4302 domain-containing protein [Bacteroides pyogenes]MBR8706462.1 hypothetical protein [Bacteroides pyogenes]